MYGSTRRILGVHFFAGFHKYHSLATWLTTNFPITTKTRGEQINEFQQIGFENKGGKQSNSKENHRRNKAVSAKRLCPRHMHVQFCAFL